MRAYRKKLKNGLRIITVPMKDTPTVTVLALSSTGLRDENKEKNGISHFMEHLMFKGTPTRPSALAISHELDSLGAEHNAFTSYERTGYYVKGRAKHFGKFLDIISDVYKNPLFPEPEVEKEKGVIVEEINLDKDLPMRHVGRILDELMYGDQPSGWSVLGTGENVKKMKRDDFLEYHRKNYVSGKTIVVVAGKIDNKEARRAVEEAFRDINAGKLTKRFKTKEKQTTPKLRIEHKKSDQTHLMFGFRSFNALNSKTPALVVLSSVLGGGMSSRLFQKLREEMGVCYYVNAWQSSDSDTGSFDIDAGVNNKRVLEVVEEIMKEIKKIKELAVDEKELKKAKEYVIGNFLMGFEGTERIGNYYGFQEVMGKELISPNKWAQKIKKVSSKDVQKVAKEVFKNKNLNLALIGPFGKKDEKKFKKVLRI